MKKIIATFDDLFTLYSRLNRVEAEIETVIADIKPDFDHADYAALTNLAGLKREEITYFFEHGYLSDNDYNDGITAIYNIEELAVQEGEQS